MNQLTGQVRERRGQVLTLSVGGVGDLHMPLLSDPPQADRMALCFRPHALRVDVADAAHDARYVWLPGTIEASEFLGEATRYRVRVGSQSLAVDQAHHAGLSKFPVGGAVSLGLEPSQVRLFAA
jgi:iron(III) transport system ATP-binding protein